MTVKSNTESQLQTSLELQGGLQFKGGKYACPVQAPCILFVECSL